MILTKEKMFRKLTRNLNLLYVIAFAITKTPIEINRKTFFEAVRYHVCLIN
jgi:hypothetical protein